MQVSGEPVVEQWEPAPLAQVDEGQGERDRKSTSHTDMGSGMEPTESVMYSWWGKRLDRDVPGEDAWVGHQRSGVGVRETESGEYACAHMEILCLTKLFPYTYIHEYIQQHSDQAGGNGKGPCCNCVSVARCARCQLR